MYRRILVAVCTALLLGPGLPVIRGEVAAPLPGAVEGREPVLTLSEALALAQAHNRQIENAVLGVGIAEDKTSQARALGLPQLKVSGLAGYLLSPLEFHFPKGAFGDYSGVGPIPGRDTVVETPREFNFSGLAQLTQPLSQHYRIHLLVQGAKLGMEAERERLRAQRQLVRMKVKQVYCSIVQAGAALRAAEGSRAFLAEYERTLQAQLAERAILRPELLDAQARLAEAEANGRQWQDMLATQREQLNLLLGRPLETPFAVEAIAAPDELETDLAEARSRALANRPELRIARLGTRGAEYNQRAARAAYIPDLSLAVSHTRTTTSDILPSRITTAGLLLQWDLYDGGRRRRELSQSGRTLRQARNTEADTEAQVLIEVGAKLSKLRQARLLWRAAGLQLEAEETRLRDVTHGLRERTVLQRDLLQQNAATEAANNRYQQALQGYWSARAEFENALGID